MNNMTIASLGAALFTLLLWGCASARMPSDNSASMAEPQKIAVAPVAAPAPRQPTLEERAKTLVSQRAMEIDNAKAAVARDPKNWRVFSDLGVVYYKQGMYDPAIAAFQQALALHSVTTILEAEQQQQAAQDAERAALAAKRQADEQRMQEMQSKKEMNELFGMISGIAGMQNNSQAQMLLSTMQSVNNQMNAAPVGVPPLSPEIKAESSLKAKCEVANIYVYLGAAYFGKKDYQQSVAALDSALQLDPSRTETLKTTAEAQYFLGRYDECIATLARYHAIAPVESETLLRLSDAYRALGMEPESDKAFNAFLAKLDKTPGDIVKLMQVGALCLSHWRYEDAVGFLTSARQSAAASPEQSRRLLDAERRQYHMDSALLLMLAEADSNLGRTADAIALLRDATAQEPSNPKAWYMLARCCDEAGDADTAVQADAAAVKCLKTGATPGPADNYIQVCRAATGSAADAVKRLETQLAGVPLTPGGGVDQWCLLAFAYEKAGRVPEAIEILNRCQSTMPAYAKARLALDRIARQASAERGRLLAESDAALKSGDQGMALSKLAEAYRLTVAGPDKEELRKKLLAMAARMDPPPAMTSEAQDHYLRGNVALKVAKTPMDLGRSLSEYQWAVFYSPWMADLYFNTSAVKKLENRTAAAVGDLKLYLAGQPGARNVDEVLNRLYEFDYQREQKLRELSTLAVF